MYKIQNSTIINLPSQTEEIMEEIRESFSFLNNLISLNNIIEISSIENEKLLNEINLLNIDLQTLENNLYIQNNPNHLVKFYKENEIKESIKNGISLKIKSDLLQMKIITIMMKNSQDKLSQIIGDRIYLQKYSGDIMSNYLIKSSILYSNPENKRRVYFLLDDQEKFNSKIDPFENYTFIETIDCSNNLKKNRIQLHEMYDSTIKLIFSIDEIQNKLFLDVLIKKQYFFNKQIVYITYIMLILTIIMTILSFK